MLPTWNPEVMCAEIRRVAAKGCRAVTMPELPHLEGLPSHHDDEFWGPVFRTLSEENVVMCLHIGTSFGAISMAPNAPIDNLIILATQVSAMCAQEILARDPLADELARLVRVGDQVARRHEAFVGAELEAALVAVRSTHTGTGAARNDDVRVERADVLDGQPRPFQRSGQPVGQEDVGGGEQATEVLAAGVGLDVDRDAALAAVTDLQDEVDVGPRVLPGEAADDQRPPRVARLHVLHLYDVGAPARHSRAPHTARMSTRQAR